MKIALVIENYDPALGGNERSTQQIALELLRRGHRVTVLASRYKQPLDDGLAAEQSGGLSTRRALGLLGFRRWAMRRLDSGDFDASISMTTAVPADIVQPRSGTLRETLNQNVNILQSPIGRAFKRGCVWINPKRLTLLAIEPRTLTNPRVKRIVAISRYVADQLTHYFHIDPQRIVMIPNAVSIDVPDAAQRQAIREQARRQLQLQEQDVAYLFAAANPRLKGLDELIRAFAKLHVQSPAAKLIVAGSMRMKYHQRADALGLSDAMRWVGPTRDMVRLYIAADVTVLPTWYDSSARVVLESLRLGTPAISTRFCGASQWIADPTGQAEWASSLNRSKQNRHGTAVAGRIIDSPADIDQLTEAMVDLIDPAQRDQCRQATRSLDDRLTMARHVDAMEELLNEIASRRDE